MSDWTEERVDRLKVLWKGGASCSEIAAELRGVSRNAVIGKVHRLGLSGDVTRNAVIRKVRPAKPRRVCAGAGKAAVARQPSKRSTFLAKLGYGDSRPRVAAASDGPRLDIFDPAADYPHRCALLELRHDSCRWPIGEPGTPAFFFCGEPIPQGLCVGSSPLPYCAHHARFAYQRWRPVNTFGIAAE